MPKYSKLKELNSIWKSKPFYSHAHGYKLSLHVAPNGLRNARGTHVSVVIHLMKGEFDEDLHWPLRGKIAILLIDHEVASQIFADDIARQDMSFADEKSDVVFTRVVNGRRKFQIWLGK